MGTRSNIYVETEPGTYLGTYCHYDGYPDHMFPVISKMNNDELLGHILIAMPQGGIRNLDREKTDYLDDGTCVLMFNPHMEDWAPDYIWIKCHDGSVKWRHCGDTEWFTTQRDPWSYEDKYG